MINTGEGKDTFNWQNGTFAGEVNFAGTGGNNTADIGDVMLDKTRHIITAAGTGNALTFTNTHGDSAKIGSLNSDNQTTGTNIGTGWDSLTITGSNADVRVVERLELASNTISVSNGATLRTGDHVESTSTAATIGNYDVETQGTSSRVIFDAQVVIRQPRKFTTVSLAVTGNLNVRQAGPRSLPTITATPVLPPLIKRGRCS